jgi:GMP synthase-like glutamine amidotransferase
MRRVKKTVHVLQHTPVTPASGVVNWCFDRFQNLSVVRLDETPRYPKIKDVDLLVINGAEDFLNDPEHLSDEKNFVQSAIEDGVPCLGLNMGADVLAHALSEKKSRKSKAKQGWDQITFVDQTKFPAFNKMILSEIGSMSGFYHRSRKSVLPTACLQIAKTSKGDTAAFLYDDYVMGIYFTPELNPHSITTLASYHDIVLPISGGQKREKVIIPDDFDKGKSLLELSLDYLIKRGKHARSTKRKAY